MSHAANAYDKHLTEVLINHGFVEQAQLDALRSAAGSLGLVAYLIQLGALVADSQRTLDMIEKGYIKGDGAALLFTHEARTLLRKPIAESGEPAIETATPDDDHPAPEETVPDKVIDENSDEYFFALTGRSDFISVNEVVQMLYSGRHSGSFTLDTAHNSTDLHFVQGQVVCVDPVRLQGRSFTPARAEQPVTIDRDAVDDATRRRAEDGTPILHGLLEAGALRRLSLQDAAFQVGVDILLDALCSPADCFFAYRPLVPPPLAAKTQLTSLGAMTLLLEASRLHDEWQSLQKSHPIDQPPHAIGNLLARVAELDVSRIGMRVLAEVDGTRPIHAIADRAGVHWLTATREICDFAGRGIVEFAQHL